MLVLKISVIVLLAIAFVLDLYASKTGKKRIRYFSKTVLIPLVAAIYVLFAKSYSFLIFPALFFGWMGDLFLLEDDTPHFVGGLVSFLVGHIFFIVMFIEVGQFFKGVPPLFFLATIPYFMLLVTSYFLVLKHAKVLMFPGLFYYLTILTMSFIALTCFYSMSLPAFILSFSGTILFVMSDSFLGMREFTDLVKKDSILIMLTYVPAQLLISLGIAVNSF